MGLSEAVRSGAHKILPDKNVAKSASHLPIRSIMLGVCLSGHRQAWGVEGGLVDVEETRSLSSSQPGWL